LALRPQRPQSRTDQLAVQKAAEQDIFFREVDDALRQDKMSGFFKRYGIPVIAGVVILLAALAGYLWWDHDRKQALGQHGEELTKALDQVEAGNADAAKKQLDTLAAEADDGSGTAARLLLAGVALEQGRQADAVKGFAAVAADTSAPKPLRDLALVREIAANFDAMPPQQVVDRLKPLAIPGNPWFGSAGELTGLAYLKQGKVNLAGPLFASIARDKDSPESLRRRARQLAGLLGVDAVDDVAKAAAGDLAPESAPQPAGESVPQPAGESAPAPQ
jgi:hypothetical protein